MLMFALKSECDVGIKCHWCYIVAIARVVWAQILANYYLPDHEADAFETPTIEEPKTIFDRGVKQFLEGFSRWDAQYFLHIARHGYSYENTLAFLPLFPLCLNATATGLHLLGARLLNLTSCLLLAGVLLNTLCFTLAALRLYDLTFTLFKHRKMAHWTLIFFCCNPASIFFSALYSESLFLFLTLEGLWSLENDRVYLAAFFFGFSGATRANGIISIGFLWYYEMKKFAANLSSLTKMTLLQRIFFVMEWIFEVSHTLVIGVLPFCAYQAYAFFSYCTPSKVPHWWWPVIELASTKGYKMPGDEPLSPWCRQLLPLSYPYVQKTYWDVGFLEYYKLRQTPNFLLALPILAILLKRGLEYYRANPTYCHYLGIFPAKYRRSSLLLNSDRTFVFTVHAVALCLFATFFINIQVSTRLLCSSTPLLYWVAASHTSSAVPSATLGHSVNTLIMASYQHLPLRLILGYFWLYFITGIVVHVNWLPWT
ncbi:PIGV [Cordylochernes scorpioides]|uniref:GPI mannosyltransferase 2 n=1 Tax=Cordylochernes scorpioides TaxID=51811 RepID=A0ABY6LIQ4_9ARAC|nr:PIGV [Cordylochernes scorpioides]